MARISTVAEIVQAAQALQDRAGSRFEVRPNGYGVRVECLSCHESACHERGYQMVLFHTC